MTTKNDKRDQEIQGLTAKNRELRKQVALLADLGRRVTASLDLPTVLADVVSAACELTGAQYGALGVFDSSGKILQFITHGLTETQRKRIGALPSGKGVLGFLQQVQEPLRLADLSKHPRSVGFPKDHPSMRSFLGAPIRLGDEALGNIYLTEKQGASQFTEIDQELLILFAAQAALAIRNARLHQGVEAERTQLRTLMQASPVGVGVFDAKTKRFTEANDELARLFGVVGPSVVESLNRQLHATKYLRPDGRALTSEEQPQVRAVSRGERVQAEELRIELPRGSSVPTLVSATPIFDAEGNISAAITVVQDITPLEEIERLRSEFLGIVSHELKTPLTAIKGSAATALGSKRPLEPDETEELFKIIDEQADRLRDMVDNLLDMTRIEAGRLSVNPESCDLRKVLEEGINTFRRAGTGHEVKSQLALGLPPVKADRRRIVQVVTNLLSNAAKFAPSGIPIVIVAEGGPHQVTVRVRDQGRGIAAESLPHLFKKYSQVHADSGTKLMGTGLGLAICKGLVEAHGGRIWAESDGEGKGSTFSFTLNVAAEAPVERVSRATGTETPRQAEQRTSVTKATTRTRIMAVDDDGAILRFLHRTLDDAGYHPVATSNPAEVVALVEREEPALLLLDVNLPGTTGYDLLKRVREFSGVPVIFLTARGDDDDVVKALRMGADDYITKPFSPSELLARIEATLRRRTLSDTLEVIPPYAIDGLGISFAERLVTRDGQPVALSATEYKLLYELATHAGRVLTHEQILQRVWGEEYSGATELLRSVVRNLRRKIGDDARSPRFVFTEAQVGYRMPKSS